MAPPVDVTPIISVLDKINTTLKNSLTSIEAKAKNNDVNPSLEEMNDHLLEIMASIPTQGGGGTKKKKSSAKKPAAKAKGAAKSAKPAAPPETIPLSSDPNINKVVESLNIINNTLSSTLAAIDSRIKTNNINPALATMNEYLSEISTSIPEQGGGGTRRLRVKKGKKALRNRRA
jgi:soluble cytochrome b562